MPMSPLSIAGWQPTMDLLWSKSLIGPAMSGISGSR